MDSILVKGGGALQGQIPIAGAKNACLALMPATLLSEEPLTLTNAPRLSDIRTMTQLLGSLGAEATSLQDGLVLALSSHGAISTHADYDIVRKMRASNLVLGPLLAREGHAEVSLPGGCAIGARPMDIHTDGLEKMGAEIELRDGYLHAKASGGTLKGAVIDFPFASVGSRSRGWTVCTGQRTAWSRTESNWAPICWHPHSAGARWNAWAGGSTCWKPFAKSWTRRVFP
jgi:UDP-N-acetylglucosamine 1-carboxyvinyltransferase